MRPYDHQTPEMRQKARNQILSVTKEDIRALAQLIEDTFSTECICTVACESKANEDRDCFDTVEPLYKA